MGGYLVLCSHTRDSILIRTTPPHPYCSLDVPYDMPPCPHPRPQPSPTLGTASHQITSQLMSRNLCGAAHNPDKTAQDGITYCDYIGYSSTGPQMGYHRSTGILYQTTSTNIFYNPLILNVESSIVKFKTN